MPGGPGGGGPGGRSDRSSNTNGRPSHRSGGSGTSQSGGIVSTVANNYGGHDSYLGVSTGSDKFASRVQGKLARKRFDDWMDRFAPKERELADRATNDEYLHQGLASADEAVQGSFDSAQGQTERRLGRYGVSQTSEQREQNERASGLAEVTTKVNARNRVRRAERDRRLSLMSGGGLSGAGDRTGDVGE